MTHTVYFDGCPFRLKSPKMVDWLRALILSIEAMKDESSHGFSADEQVIICYVAVVTQLKGNLWVIEPQGLAQLLGKSIVKAEAFEDGLELFAYLKNLYDQKCQTEDIPEDIYWGCCQGALICCIYLIELSLKIGNITDNTLAAMDQFNVQLSGCINEAKEENEKPDFSVEAEYFDRLTKLIPKIEENGNAKLIRMAYEFAHDYYEATRRFTLAEQFASKLNQLGN